MTALRRGSAARGPAGFLLALLPALALAQPKPPPQEILSPQPFEGSLWTTEGEMPGETPNAFSPWFDTFGALQLPDTFDTKEAALSALESRAEAAAATVGAPPPRDPDAPFFDLETDTVGGLLATTEYTLFRGQSLLLDAPDSVFVNLSKQADLPFGEFVWPMSYQPHDSPLFERHRPLTAFGPIRVGLDLAASTAYNSNVFGVEHGAQGDMVFTLQPVLFVEAGEKSNISLIYAPTVTRFSRFTEFNAVNQSVSFRIRYPIDKLDLATDVIYYNQTGLTLNSPSVADTTLFLARVFGDYDLTGKSSLGFSAQSTYQESDPGGSLLDSSATGSWNYQIAPKTRVSVSFTGGLYEAPADQQTYEAVRFGAYWRPTYNSRLFLDVGMELRQLSIAFDNGRTQMAIPVFRFEYDFNPTSTTLLALSFSRIVYNNTFSDVGLSVSTGGTATFLIRLMERVNFRAELGAGITQQYAPDPDAEGHFYFTRGAIIASYQVLRMVEFQVFDNFQQRFGNQVGTNYFSNVAGISMNIKF